MTMNINYRNIVIIIIIITCSHFLKQNPFCITSTSDAWFLMDYYLNYQSCIRFSRYQIYTEFLKKREKKEWGWRTAHAPDKTQSAGCSMIFTLNSSQSLICSTEVDLGSLRGEATPLRWAPHLQVQPHRLSRLRERRAHKMSKSQPRQSVEQKQLDQHQGDLMLDRHFLSVIYWPESYEIWERAKNKFTHVDRKWELR